MATEAVTGRAAAPLIAAAGISLRLGSVSVLEDVDLTVREGEIVTLIGPNGSGKTTLVRAVLGLVTPDRGTVERRTGMRIGYVPQHLNVDHTLPLAVRRFLGLGGPAPGAGMARVLGEVGAPDVLERPLAELSGGELKRVMLARALVRDPDLLVLDEPMAGVDISGQAELYSLIQTIRDRRNCGVLLVSHNLHLVMAATDQVVCLNHHVCCHGRPDAVRRDPEFLALFGAGAADALAVYSHHHDHRHDISGQAVPDAGDGAESGDG